VTPNVICFDKYENEYNIIKAPDYRVSYTLYNCLRYSKIYNPENNCATDQGIREYIDFRVNNNY